MTDSDVSIFVNFDWQTQKMVLKDNTDYLNLTPPVLLEHITGYAKVLTPAGIIHSNLHTSSGIGVPDIVMQYDDTMKQLNLPTMSGSIYSGVYEFTYQVRLWGVKQSGTVVGVDGADNAIILDGDHFNSINANLGSYFYLKGTTTEGIVNPINVIYDTTGNKTYVYVTESLADQSSINVIDGLNWFGVDDYEDFIIIKSIDYSIKAPKVKIDIKSNCVLSTLVSTDITDYNIIYKGQAIAPLSITREHILTPPLGSGYLPIPVSGQAVVNAKPNIWTKTWTASVKTTLDYNISLDTSWFGMGMVVFGVQYHNVECVMCMCDVYECIVALNEKYKLSRIGRNMARTNMLKEILDAVIRETAILQLAIQCGLDTSHICKTIAELLSYEDCNCDVSPSNVSKEIEPKI